MTDLAAAITRMRALQAEQATRALTEGELGRVIGIEPGRILVLEEGGRLNALRIAKDAER